MHPLSPRGKSWLRLATLCLSLAIPVCGVATTRAQASETRTSQRAGHTGKAVPAAASHQHHKQTAQHGHARPAKVRHAKSRHAPRTARSLARSRKLQRAFVASAQLRPMAQQLATNRTPQAYAGVTNYAKSHTGDAAAAAYLALGHAYLLDHRYPEAIESLSRTSKSTAGLEDYADFLTAQAQMQAGKLADAEATLTSFATKHPDSIFVADLPVTIAELSLQQNDPQTALRTLAQHSADPIASHADFKLTLARAQQMSGDTEAAGKTYRQLYLSHPLSPEAQQARTQLLTLGSAAEPLTIAERQHHADALYNSGRYNQAAEDYRALAADPAMGDATLKNRLLAAAMVCDYKLKRATRQEAEALPDTDDDAGARRSYVLMELARDRDDGETQRSIVEQMERRFPVSPWLAEALYSSGNMYMLRKDYPHAIEYYSELAHRFPVICREGVTTPCSNYAPNSHWRAAWLNYRIGRFADAAREFDEQIATYPGGKEIPSALYWRGRVYQLEEHSPEKAAAYYQAVKDSYLHYYYAEQASVRLAELGNVTPTHMPQLDGIHPETIPALTDDVPQDDPHVVKARLLANAGLNEYISPEIQAAEGSSEWGAFAESAIYTSAGENYKAMHVMKRALPFYTSAPIEAIPLAYWRILFPEAYWSTIQTESAKNGLDPYMVASLIRQESEFNPTVVSYANAYGLMQLLPSVGSELAHKEGMHHFDKNELLDPATNIRLGTLYLRQTLDKFGGKPEYAFAAYNAGDSRVADWDASGNFHSMDEFIESIPFGQTRDYVQAILRNELIYRELTGHAVVARAPETTAHPAPAQPGAETHAATTPAEQARPSEPRATSVAAQVEPPAARQ